MELLKQRLLLDDVVELPDWEAADRLNAPDPSLPSVVTWTPILLTIGRIMDCIGPQAGAELLDTLSLLTPTNAVLRWGLRAMEQSGLELSAENTRRQIDALVDAGVVTPEQRSALFSLSRRERSPSWAEFTGIHVDARAVGIARGARE